MKLKKSILLISFFVLCNNTLFSNELEDSVQNTKQSTPMATRDYLQDTLHIDREQYKYADNYRYTLTGELPLKDTKIKPLNFGIFLGTEAAFIAVQHIIQVQTIWSETTSFRFVEDGDYAMYVDKLGHFYGSYFSGYMYNEFFLMSGFSRESATLLGCGLGLAYSTYVEIMDGFGKDWGFSPTDFYSDVSGSVFFLLQHYIPYMQNFTPKFMYFPPEWHGELSRKPSSFFIDDYSSQTFFLSMNVHNMLPESMKRYWPAWLQLSVGYAARNMVDYLNPGITYDPSRSPVKFATVAGSPRYILALDYDLVKLLPDGPNWWNWFKQSMNYIKLPSPAVEFGETTRLFLLYPFHF